MADLSAPDRRGEFLIREREGVFDERTASLPIVPDGAQMVTVSRSDGTLGRASPACRTLGQPESPSDRSPDKSALNQAFAIAHSRTIVASEMPTTSAALLDRQPSEVPQLDNALLTRVERGHADQSLMQGERVDPGGLSAVVASSGCSATCSSPPPRFPSSRARA